LSIAKLRKSSPAVAFGVVVLLAVSGCGSPTREATPTASATGDPFPMWTMFDQDPTRFAPQVVRSADQAGIDPQLLMAILYNESYKPHDPSFEREWLRLNPGAALGIVNMHEAAFDDTKRGRSFAARQWTELPDDPDLAILAAAWYLHDLAARLPSTWKSAYTKDELLALGYNAGPSSMLEFANGAKPGPVAQNYLDQLHSNWAKAAAAVHG
jgi:soluble lytic murein transglycosylase-like protein